ncbi:Protein FAR-RED IMPAIRED RESPONSE 1 [Bienertia sinuspersici]
MRKKSVETYVIEGKVVMSKGVVRDRNRKGEEVREQMNRKTDSDKAMECHGVLGGDAAFDDVNGGIECDEVYHEGSDVARGAGLDELHVDQCVGDSNIGIRFGSGSGYNMCDNGTQREDVTKMTNGDGVVTPRVGSVYSSWEEVERMFKVYGKKKGFGVIRGQSAYYGGTKKKRAMTMRCDSYGCPDMKLKSDEKKRKKNMEVGGCSGEELKFRRRRKEQLWEIRKVSLDHIGHKPEPGQAKLVKQYRMEHFTASMRSRVLNDIDAGVLYAELKEELLEVVYDSFTKEEFDSRWEEVTSDCGIVNDEWLSGLFVERRSVLGRNEDYAVGSINSFFDKIVTRQTRLCEFGEKYVAAVERRITQEKEADDKGHKYTRNLLTGIPLEKYFQRMYTDAKFRAFQRECERLIYCYVKEEIPKGDHIYSYVIEDRVWKTRKGVCYHDPTKTERTKRFDKMNVVFDALAFEHVAVNAHVTLS